MKAMRGVRQEFTFVFINTEMVAMVGPLFVTVMSTSKLLPKTIVLFTGSGSITMSAAFCAETACAENSRKRNCCVHLIAAIFCDDCVVRTDANVLRISFTYCSKLKILIRTYELIKFGDQYFVKLGGY